ncbi:MAG: tRNA glutamyl-Q(34) synthetase GluQRS [Planctomycetes bacterium]|nr:tRNA glutamyl-Q(34) synthetase GluQRS [Planctomycetota bacterium]
MERETGRLAPTPSGYLHLGNARSFLLAWLWARSRGGRVILRIEDIDQPRCRPEYRAAALADLAWLGLDWDAGGEPVPGAHDQSTRIELYREHLARLAAAGHAYPCVCSRKDIEEASSAPHGDDGPVYPGTCRGRFADAEQARRVTGREPAWRFRFEGPPLHFHDELMGDVTAEPVALGDFVLWRRDDLPAYQLAVVVDDALQGVTQVLRGRDLVLSTARQLALYRALGLSAPTRWAHVPFVQEAGGRRMAKREGDLALRALRELGTDPARVVGLLAFTAGLLPAPAPVRPRELLPAFDLRRLARSDYALQPQELAWLKAT